LAPVALAKINNFRQPNVLFWGVAARLGVAWPTAEVPLAAALLLTTNMGPKSHSVPYLLFQIILWRDLKRFASPKSESINKKENNLWTSSA